MGWKFEPKRKVLGRRNRPRVSRHPPRPEEESKVGPALGYSEGSSKVGSILGSWRELGEAGGGGGCHGPGVVGEPSTQCKLAKDKATLPIGPLRMSGLSPSCAAEPQPVASPL